MFAVVVTFKLKPGTMTAFMPLMVDNAATSLRTEPGCHQFDVATDPDRVDEVFLYELYTDARAFAAHLATDHFTAFDTAVSKYIAAKDVRTYSKVIQ